jgi:protease I
MDRYDLNGKKVAVLATEGFEESEFIQPITALKQNGAMVNVVSLADKPIRAMSRYAWTKSYPVDMTIGEADAEEFDALVLPGGVMNPDRLRQDEEAVAFVRAFFEEHKPVAAICHGLQILIDADVLMDRIVTSYPSIRRDLENAGAAWVDKEVVVDNGLVTSRTPDDLPAFCDKLCEEVAEGIHSVQRT